MIISNSAIQTFKQCRRMYELRYVYDLVPVSTADALARGLAYHEGVENLLKNDSKPIEDPKIRAMVEAFNIYIVPILEYRGVKIQSVEEWFEYRVPNKRKKKAHIVMGRTDATTDRGLVVEHKTTSSLIDGAYWQRLEFDEQIMSYMLATKSRGVYYTVCVTPTIRQKQNETDDEFYERCLKWYSEDTERKIDVQLITKEPYELERFAKEQDRIITEIEKCKHYYRNPGNCMKWGKMCEYAPICMNFDPNQEYIQFKKRERNYEKVGEAKD